MVATEESRLRDAKVLLDLGEVQGAQIAASDAAKAEAAAMTGGVQGLGAAGTSMLENSELYNKTKPQRKKLNSIGGPKIKKDVLFNQLKGSGTSYEEQEFLDHLLRN